MWALASKLANYNPRLLSTLACALELFIASASAEPVDLELVIAADVSRSVTAQEAALQREGVIQAFRSTDVTRAIEMGALGKIGVVYVDWSSEYINTVVVDWHVVHDHMTATMFAEELSRAPLTWGQRTSISSALVFATELIETNNLSGTRRVIDISGDGPNNFGLSLAPVREETIAKGIVINGLPIIMGGNQVIGSGFFPNIDGYYQRCVIGGTSAFLVVARGFDDFAVAMRRKLILEISNRLLPDSTDGEPLLKRTAGVPGNVQGHPPAAQTVPILRAPALRAQNCDY
jgi:hypothetical protein